MPSVGINRESGKRISGFEHLVQSLRVLFATRIGSRIMRRAYGSLVPNLLGENATPRTILRFYVAVIVAVELWEPRFRIKKISMHPSNSPETVRVGKLRFTVRGEYRPRGHLGDPTPELQDRSFTM